MYIHVKMAISPVLVWYLTTPDSTQGPLLRSHQRMSGYF